MKPGGWLNDYIVKAYLEALENGNEQQRNSGDKEDLVLTTAQMEYQM